MVNKQSLKVLILVANSTIYPSKLMVPLIRNTWGKDNRVETFIYQGGEKNSYHDENKIYLNISNSYEDAPLKTMKVLKYINENFEFDFVFRVTTTCYINITNLLLFLENIEPLDCYLGKEEIYPSIRGGNKESVKFISGAGIIISRDVVKKIIDKEESYDHQTLLDDVALGKLITEKTNVPFQEGFREDYYYGLPKTKNIDPKNYHYRFRLDLQYFPRYLECLILINLYYKFKKNVFESKYWQIIFLTIDFCLNIIFLFFKLINPKYIKYLLHKLIQNIYKLLVNILKLNLLIYNLSRKIKKIYLKLNIKK
tara:strand:+ start:6890 stop:7822 length:933 start_codon:yes stop_codon:yes gene_type:complete